MLSLMQCMPRVMINALRIMSKRVQEFSDRYRELDAARGCRVARALLRLAQQGARKVEGGILIIRPSLAVNSPDTVPQVWDAPYLRGTLNGAIVMIILGYTLRTVPRIMGMPLPPDRHARALRRLYGCCGRGFLLECHYRCLRRRSSAG